MCNFLSALVLRNGDVLHHPMLDSHSDLVRHFEVPDTREHHQHFAKVELTPVGDWLDVSLWEFRLDEETAPGWWGDVKGSAEARLRSIAEQMILKTGEHSLLIDGCWVIGGDAVVRDVRAARIAGVWGGTITNVWGGTITNVWGGTITNVSGGTITNVRGGMITNVRGGMITNVWGRPWTPLLDDSAKRHVLVKPPTKVPAKKSASQKPATKKAKKP